MAAALLLGAGVPQQARADIFLLKTGGKVSGTVLKRGKRGEYIVKSDQGALVTLSRRQVDSVDRQDEVDLQYAKRSRAMPDTIKAHREMAKWCKENRRNKLSQVHLQRIVELDPNDEAARLSLGYQQHRGRWLTRDDLMTARGLQKHADGKYRTPQDIALRERTKRRDQAQTDWFRKIRNWVSWLDDRRAAEAAQLISGVRDPQAAPAIVKLLDKQKNQSIRDLLTATLAEIKSPLTVTTLVDFSLNEPDPDVRDQCLEFLIRYHRPLSLAPYVQALNDRIYSNEIINRSAEALRRIEDPEAISPLIDALVTTHKFKNLKAPTGNMNPTFTSGGGGGGGGLSMGGDKDKMILRDIKNLKVRQALVELSGGQDYEFDERLWRRWFVKEQIHEYVDTRRDQ